jgi:hypothetical protein
MCKAGAGETFSARPPVGQTWREPKYKEDGAGSVSTFYDADRRGSHPNI